MSGYHIIAMAAIFAVIFLAGPIDNYIKERKWAKKSIAEGRPVMTYSDFHEGILDEVT